LKLNYQLEGPKIREKKWSIQLIRFAAIFGIIGTFLGSKMSRNMECSLRPIHAHILLVGWLSVFAWGIFYKVYTVKYKKNVSIHAITAMIGAFVQTFGMRMYNLNPFRMGRSELAPCNRKRNRKRTKLVPVGDRVAE